MHTRHLTFSLQDEQGKPVISFSAELHVSEANPHTWQIKDSKGYLTGIGDNPHEALLDWLGDRLEEERVV